MLNCALLLLLVKIDSNTTVEASTPRNDRRVLPHLHFGLRLKRSQQYGGQIKLAGIQGHSMFSEGIKS